MITREELQAKWQENNQKHGVDSAERKLSAMKIELQKRDLDKELNALEHEQLKADITKMDFEKALAEEIKKLPKPTPTTPEVASKKEENK